MKSYFRSIVSLLIAAIPFSSSASQDQTVESTGLVNTDATTGTRHFTPAALMLIKIQAGLNPDQVNELRVEEKEKLLAELMSLAKPFKILESKSGRKIESMSHDRAIQ